MPRVRWCSVVAALLIVAGGLAYGLCARAVARPYRQVVVAVDGIEKPVGVAVGADGGLYVADRNRVIKRSTGSSTELPFDTDEVRLTAVAVDPRGTVYVTGLTARRGQCQADSVAARLAAGSTHPTRLSIGDYPDGVAVDAAGNLYYAGNDGVRRIPSGATAATDTLPVTGGSHLGAVAVGAGGDVYVVERGQLVGDRLDKRATVIKLAGHGAPQTVLPFTDLGASAQLATDDDANIYVADTGNNRVLKLAAGTDVPTVLPFTALDHPTAVAVGGDGSIYVVDAERLVALLPDGAIHGLADATSPRLRRTPPGGVPVSTVSCATGGFAAQTA